MAFHSVQRGSISLMLDGLYIWLITLFVLPVTHEFLWQEVLILVGAHICLVEPLYYGYHRLLHSSYLYRTMHQFHHLERHPLPESSLNFNPLERMSYTLLFGIPIFMIATWKPVSFQSIFIYLICFDWLNMMGHVPDDRKKVQKPSVFREVFVYSAPFHAKHHEKGTVNYSLFMPIFDRWFGTTSK